MKAMYRKKLNENWTVFWVWERFLFGVAWHRRSYPLDGNSFGFHVNFGFFCINYYKVWR